jgi:hypothetical protein
MYWYTFQLHASWWLEPHGFQLHNACTRRATYLWWGSNTPHCPCPCPCPCPWLLDGCLDWRVFLVRAQHEVVVKWQHPAADSAGTTPVRVYKCLGSHVHVTFMSNPLAHTPLHRHVPHHASCMCAPWEYNHIQTCASNARTVTIFMCKYRNHVNRWHSCVHVRALSVQAHTHIPYTCSFAHTCISIKMCVCIYIYTHTHTQATIHRKLWCTKGELLGILRHSLWARRGMSHINWCKVWAHKK